LRISSRFGLNSPSLEEFLNVCGGALEAAAGSFSALRPNFLSLAACVVLAIVGLEDFLEDLPCLSLMKFRSCMATFIPFSKIFSRF
jgi:hypothetical protein